MLIEHFKRKIAPLNPILYGVFYVEEKIKTLINTIM